MAAMAGIELPALFTRRYNIAPTQKVAAIHQSRPGEILESIWGFEHPQTRTPVINARCETLHERPMFQPLLENSRCLIPADGFYEWKDRQPYYFQLEGGRLFAFAGLWSNNHCVIITRAADAGMCGIHDRMPLLLPLDRQRQWLESFCIPEPPPLQCRPVSRRVNRVDHDDPDCLAPAAVQGDLSLFPEDD